MPASDGALLVAGYKKVEKALIARGNFSTPPPWLAALSPFWRSGAFRMVVRKGRQVFASTCVCPRVVITHAQFGTYEQARGTRGTIALFSTRQKEADERLFNIERGFYDLGIKVKIRGDVIEVPNRPVIIQSFPATSDAARGGNYWCIWQDEQPAWRDGDGANPARERDAATVPGCVTHPNARAYSVGTPMGLGDYHAQLVERGDTDGQRVYSGPTWHWNPSLSEARCRELQPDERIFNREFAAIPQADALSAFDGALLERAMRTKVPADWTDCGRIMVIDPSAGSSDAFAWAVAGWRKAPSGAQSVLEFTHIDGIADAAKQGVSSATVISRITKQARALGIDALHGDQFEQYALTSAFAARGFSYRVHTWTAPLKERCVEQVRGWLRDGLLVLPDHARLRRELLAFEERISPTGALTFRGRHGGHDDMAMLVLLCALVDVEGGLANSPTGKRVTNAGLLDWMESEVARINGVTASPLIVVAEAPEDLVELAVPERFAGSSTFTGVNGRAYGVEAGRIRGVRQSDIDAFRRLGFTHATE